MGAVSATATTRGSLAAIVLLLAACRVGEPVSGLAVATDSTRDTVFIRVSGHPEAVAGTRMEMALSPATGASRIMDDVGEVLVDGAARLWAFDPDARRLVQFDTNAAVLRRIGRGGAGPGEFGCVSGMALLPGNGIGVWDACNSRIVLLDSVGNETRSIRTPGSYRTYDGLKRDRAGRLFIKQPSASGPPVGGNRSIGLAEISGAGVMGEPEVPPALVPPPVRYVDASGGGLSARYAPRSLWAWHPDGHFVVAGGETFRVVIAPRSGRPTVITRPTLPAIPITGEARSREQEAITKQLRGQQPDWQWSGPALPRIKPAVDWLFVGRDGRIWVRLATPDQVAGTGGQAPAGDAMSRYEVYDVHGRFIRAVDVAAGVRLLEADGDQIWGLRFDADELPTIVRLRVLPG